MSHREPGIQKPGRVYVVLWFDTGDYVLPQTVQLAPAHKDAEKYVA
ncbi:MAG TPA: hypothetical protein VMX16_19365 [Terriglobia bacterium]|nr:hypothetical protein [Terriglobia bacterium]